jgi:hypothetical protein
LCNATGAILPSTLESGKWSIERCMNQCISMRSYKLTFNIPGSPHDMHSKRSYKC